MWVENMDRFNRLFWGPWSELSRLSGALAPTERPLPVNVWTHEEGAIVTANLPGAKPEDFEIQVEGREVSIRGSRQLPTQEDAQTRRRELWQGSVHRTVQLPFAPEANEVEAHYHNGILEIRLPRAESDKPRKIDVRPA